MIGCFLLFFLFVILLVLGALFRCPYFGAKTACSKLFCKGEDGVYSDLPPRDHVI